MNDQDISPENGADAAAQDDGVEIPPVMIAAQYIKDLSFENPQGPDLLTDPSQNPDVSIEVGTNSRALGDDLHEVTLFIKSEAKVSGRSVFIIELTYAGAVQITGVGEEEREALLLIEVPRHLFPFARGVVATVTREGGFPPLMINPVDFTALYLQQRGGA